MEKIIWIPRGTFNDETNGHVDNIACFLRPGVIGLHWCDNKKDPQYEISREALACIEASVDAIGRSFEVVKFPQPAPLLITAQESIGVDQTDISHGRGEGERMAGSYINFYIGNSVVVFPKLDSSQDDVVAELLARQFSGRKIIGIEAREILLGGGNIHCITQQQPSCRTSS